MTLRQILFVMLIIMSNTVLARDVISYAISANGDTKCKLIMYGDRSNERPVLKIFWNGHCSSGFIQGKGSLKMIYPNGAEMITTVNFINGMEQGPGLAETTYLDGTKIIFSGVFKDGLYANGTRTITSPTKSFREVYEGPFLNSEKSGKGMLYYKKGDVEYKYSGEFSENKFNGFGSIFLQNKGVTWTGPFANGEMNGTGRYETVNGKYGSMTFANGEWVSEEADAPAPINVEQLRQTILPNSRIIPFNCTTFGAFTTCQ